MYRGSYSYGRYIEIFSNFTRNIFSTDLLYDFLNSITTNYTDDIKNYRFNNAVAKIRELSNKLVKQKVTRPLFDYCWSIYLRLFAIITPHFSSELAEIAGLKNNLEEIVDGLETNV